MILPDYTLAATKAAQTLIDYNICSAPVDPLHILKKTKGVRVMTFAEMSDEVGVKRTDLLNLMGDQNRDAVTATDEKSFLVTYNKGLSFNILQKSLARELGHIILRHDGSRPAEVELAEARCFALHLICPRALIHAIRSSRLRLTVEVLDSLTACYERCLSFMRRIPGTNVPAAMNAQIRNQFMPYIKDFFEIERHLSTLDGSALADFGTFMDGYTEREETV